jgi:hypothetical protein
MGEGGIYVAVACFSSQPCNSPLGIVRFRVRTKSSVIGPSVDILHSEMEGTIKLESCSGSEKRIGAS